MLAIVLIVVVIMGCDNGSKKEQMVKAKQIPLEDFFKNPEKSGYQISPDGKYPWHEGTEDGIYIPRVG